MEPISIFGLAAYTLFKPVLEDIAKGVVDDAAKNYVSKAFKSVISVINKEPLTKATGAALAELLQLIESELLDAELTEDEVRGLTPFVKLLIEHEAVLGSLEPLFLDPDYYFDPKTLVVAWLELDESVPVLPDDFSWQRIAKRFSRNVRVIRNQTGDIKNAFEDLQK